MPPSPCPCGLFFAALPVMDDAVVSADAAPTCATPGVRPDYFAAARHTPQGRPAAGRTMDAAARCGAATLVGCALLASLLSYPLSRASSTLSRRARALPRPAGGGSAARAHLLCSLVPLSFSPARGRKAQHG